MQDKKIIQLRLRGCWDIAAAQLTQAAEREQSAAVQRAALLVEKCLFTLIGWQEAEEALLNAEAVIEDTEYMGALASERMFFYYTQTLMNGDDKQHRTYNALTQADGLLSTVSTFRPLFEFRRGLIAENLYKDWEEAKRAYSLAHNLAQDIEDKWLLSYTFRHLGSLHQQDGNISAAHACFSSSLSLREDLGFAIGIAPALVTLAAVSSEHESVQLLIEARRFVRAFNGIPVWLANI